MINKEYIKDIIRMIIMGYGYVAMAHIYYGFIGVPVVDFVEAFCDVADREFMLDESFVPFFVNVKTTQDLENRVIYKATKIGWS